MPDNPADFDDEADHGECFGSPLPLDDRLWRHPSEVASGAGPLRPGDEDPRLIARRRWMSSQPTKAGAWSAGLVGALLATGLVLVGTHLATAMTAPSASPGDPPVVTTADVARPSAAPSVVPKRFVSQTTTVGPSLMRLAEGVGGATVLLAASRHGVTISEAGLVVGSDCLVITSSRLVQTGEMLTVTLADGRQVPGQVVGIDATTGIAVVRCEMAGLATIHNAAESVTPHEMVALVVGGPKAMKLSIGLVRASDQRAVAGSNPPPLDGIETDIPPVDDGAAIVDGDGDVVGIVTGTAGGSSVATPAWLAVSVARQIAAAGHVTHGWLGIDGLSVTLSGGRATGVKVLAVVPHSAAARAGIRPGDVIRSVDGRTTGTMTLLQARLYCIEPGEPVAIDVVRGSKDLTETALLTEKPAA